MSDGWIVNVLQTEAMAGGREWRLILHDSDGVFDYKLNSNPSKVTEKMMMMLIIHSDIQVGRSGSYIQFHLHFSRKER